MLEAVPDLARAERERRLVQYGRAGQRRSFDEDVGPVSGVVFFARQHASDVAVCHSRHGARAEVESQPLVALQDDAVVEEDVAPREAAHRQRLVRAHLVDDRQA